MKLRQPLLKLARSGLLALMALSACQEPLATPGGAVDDLEPQFSLDPELLAQAETEADFGLVEATTVAAAGYSEIGFAGYVQAETVIREVLGVHGQISHLITYTEAMDGTSSTRTRQEQTVSVATAFTGREWPQGVNCSAIRTSGYLDASTQHTSSWTVTIELVPVTLSRYWTSDDREECPPPERATDTETTTTGGGGGEGGGAVEWCLVEVEYYVDTFEIISVTELYCWTEGA